MRTELWTIRHGETAWNVEGRLQGASDSPLTARGRRQSEAAREAIARLDLRAIYTSDLGRARQTTEIVRGERPVEIHLEPRLREISYGTVEGLTWGEIARQHPELHRELERRQPDFAPPGGETKHALTARVAAAMRDIARAHAGGAVLVVSHGGALAAFFRHVLAIPADTAPAFRAENCALSCFEHAGGHFRLRTWNAADHLRDL